MLHVYMDLNEGGAILPDGEGVSVPDLATARMLAVRAARDVMREDLLSGRISLCSSIVVRTASGSVLLDLPFHEAVSIDWGAGMSGGIAPTTENA